MAFLLSKMSKLLLLLSIFASTLLYCSKTYANLQKEQDVLLDNVKVSLLTCSPGDELYTSYGHSAIRVSDKNLNIDVVFNYGTFDFGTPYFYLKFLNGTLDYMLSTSDYCRFLEVYRREGRGVAERELLLSSKEKAEIEALLIENRRPENRFYRYDFFFDNCATRIRDIVYKVKGVSPNAVTGDRESNVISFRDCLHSFVGPNEWSGFGIDLILGVRADRPTTQYDRAMLPDFLEDLFVDQHIVGDEKVILKAPKSENTDSKANILTPNLVSSLIFLLTLILCVVEWRRSVWFRWYDVVLSVVMSILSIIFAYLWLVSEIRITSYNYNLLWASVLYIPLVVAIIRKRKSLIKRLTVLNIVLLASYFIIALLSIQYASLSIVLIAVTMLLLNVKLLRRVK